MVLKGLQECKVVWKGLERVCESIKVFGMYWYGLYVSGIIWVGLRDLKMVVKAMQVFKRDRDDWEGFSRDWEGLEGLGGLARVSSLSLKGLVHVSGSWAFYLRFGRVLGWK